MTPELNPPQPQNGTFAEVVVPCCSADSEGCACGKDERVLRAYKRREFGLPPMTPEQRKWCLDEIGSVEGYTREEWVDMDDDLLASGVLSAWTDYCRDKGLL